MCNTFSRTNCCFTIKLLLFFLFQELTAYALFSAIKLLLFFWEYVAFCFTTLTPQKLTSHILHYGPTVTYDTINMR